MCGIVAYCGKNNGLYFLIDGLQQLEYRGYDSVGIGCVDNNGLHIFKQPGSIGDLQPKINISTISTGIGHTRWATHGKPCRRNAHPFTTQDHSLAIVHNGIIENYVDIKKELEDLNYSFLSDTDSEVLLNLIHQYYTNITNYDLLKATRLAISKIQGAYAIALLDRNSPESLVFARKGSPLVVGVKDQDYFVSSDPLALSNYAEKVVWVDDNMVGKITDKLTLFQDGGEVQGIFKSVDSGAVSDRGKYESFMMKEIYEQPLCVNNCLSGRLNGYRVKLGGLVDKEYIFKSCNHITIVSCGSSYHAGLLGKYYIEEFCNNTRVSVEHASEYAYRNKKDSIGDIVVAISQSGETADTIKAIERAKGAGAFTVGICNVPSSSLARMVNCGIYLKAGSEVGVASTKAFTNQLITMILFSLWIEQIKGGMGVDYRKSLIDALRGVPELLNSVIELNSKISLLAKKYSKYKNAIYLGRSYNYPIALEGALKLKELSYIHAEGYAAAEMKHGPLALIDKNMPVVVIANNIKQYDKMVNSIKEVGARGGRVITLCGQTKVYDHQNGIVVPDTIDALCPLVSNVALQLFAYHSALVRHKNVDKPRNLAKSVTVE